MNEYKDYRTCEYQYTPWYNAIKVTNLADKMLDSYRDAIKNCMFKIDKVYINEEKKVTTVIWNDKTKTIVKCQPEDEYDKEKGLAMCFMKKALGNRGNFNDIYNEYLEPGYKEKRKEEKKAARKAKKNLNTTED